MKKGHRGSAILIGVLFAILCFAVPNTKASRICKAKVTDFPSFKKELAKEGNGTIVLSKNITVSSLVSVRGTKEIIGNGYAVLRRSDKGNGYKGVLLKVESRGALSLKNVTINGRCTEKELSSGVDGRLIEVMPRGMLQLTDVQLIHNYGSSKEVDGGGAIVIGANASCVMNSGTISDNRSMIGGGAIRIGQDGAFTMRGGTILNNATEGKKDASDFDGRGGAIHNKGAFIMKNGTISGNRAVGLKRNGQMVGGLGGAVYSQGMMEIHGGTISSNTSSQGGGGIYLTSGSKMTLRDGKLCSNTVSDGMGGGVYVNNGSQLTMDGGRIVSNRAGTGGGVYISKGYSTLSMRGGVISENQATYAQYSLGGGIRNNGGILSIIEGCLQNNRCPNGLIKDYSTAIFNDGDTTVRGCSIDGNVSAQIPIVNGAGHTMSFSGVLKGKGTTGIWNSGSLTIGELPSSRGDIIGDYDIGVKNEGTFLLQRGQIRGNQYDVYGKDGMLNVRSLSNLSHIYLSKGVYVNVIGAIESSINTCIEPADYTDGRLLAKASYASSSGDKISKHFSLATKKGYSMKIKREGLYIGTSRYSIAFQSNGGEGTMPSIDVFCDEKITLPKNCFTKKGYQFLGWSDEKSGKEIYKDCAAVCNLAAKGEQKVLYAVWGSELTINDTVPERDFYEGEYLTAKDMCYGIHAKDTLEGDLSKKLQLSYVIYPDGHKVNLPMKLDTSAVNVGTCQCGYAVVNSTGKKVTLEVKCRIVANEPPKVEGSNRCFFLDECKDWSEDTFLHEVTKQVTTHDVTESSDELMINKMTMLSKGDFRQEGTVLVTIAVRDQYGHRFYMQNNQKKQYGLGKYGDLKLQVQIVKHSSNTTVSKGGGYSRFISREYLYTLHATSKWRKSALNNELTQAVNRPDGEGVGTIWTFSADQIKQAKTYLQGQSTPFHAECLQGFLNLFSKGGESK